MTSTAAVLSPATQAPAESGVSLARLYALRSMYLVLVIGGAFFFLPQLIWHSPTARGVIPSMLGAVWVLSCLGLRYPLRMLPVLLFELVWKTIWLVDFGLPQWMAGVSTPTFKGDLQAIVLGPVLMIAVIPWKYVIRHYLQEPGARWREARS